jgi:hypothetical protein
MGFLRTRIPTESKISSGFLPESAWFGVAGGFWM